MLRKKGNLIVRCSAKVLDSDGLFICLHLDNNYIHLIVDVIEEPSKLLCRTRKQYQNTFFPATLKHWHYLKLIHFIGKKYKVQTD